MVSKDSKKIFKFLGYDYDRLSEGFETIEDIYDYVLTSKYYTSNIFKIENLTKVNRGRDVRRKSYMDFLTYIEDKKEKNIKYDNDSVIDIKFNTFNVIKNTFDECELDVRLNEINYSLVRTKLIKSKFNGKRLMEKYEITGKDIGISINKFKKYIEVVYNINFDDFIITYDLDYIYGSFENANNIK